MRACRVASPVRDGTRSSPRHPPLPPPDRLRKKEALLHRMKEQRAAEELMLQSMVLSENGARHLETTAARAEARAATEASLRPHVFVKPCDICVGVRREAVRNRLPNAAVKLCTKCQIRARDLAAAEVRRARAAAAAEAAENPPPKPKRGAPDPVRGVAALARDLARAEKDVVLARSPEERVAALHRASQLRRAVEAAKASKTAEDRRSRMAAKETPSEDERWMFRGEDDRKKSRGKAPPGGKGRGADASERERTREGGGRGRGDDARVRNAPEARREVRETRR